MSFAKGPFLNRQRAARLLEAAGLDALIVAEPEGFQYATGASQGVAGLFRRAGAGFAVVPADPALPVGAVLTDAAADAFRAASPVVDLRTHPSWIEAADVRDLADVLVATLTPGMGARRFVAGGELLDMNGVAALLRTVTGRRMPLIPTPGIVFRGVGRAADLLRKVVSFDTVYTAEAMDLLTRARPTDDAAVHDQLGIRYRPPVETVEAMIQALYDGGRLTAKQVGWLGRSPDRVRT